MLGGTTGDFFFSLLFWFPTHSQTDEGFFFIIVVVERVVEKERFELGVSTLRSSLTADNLCNAICCVHAFVLSNRVASELCLRDARRDSLFRRIHFRDHAIELGNEVPQKPLLFMKPPTAYVTEGSPIKVSDDSPCLPPVDQLTFSGRSRVLFNVVCTWFAHWVACREGHNGNYPCAVSLPAHHQYHYGVPTVPQASMFSY